MEYAVFNDGKGNRFVFPGIYSDEEQSIEWGMCQQLEVFLKIKREDNLVVLPNEEGKYSFPVLVATAGHHNFAHGSTEIWIISGPTFDEHNT